MFDNIKPRAGKFSHIHEDTAVWTCPDCGARVAGMLVLPTEKRQLVMLGRCTVCYEKGDKSTSFARIACSLEAWQSLMSITGVPCLRGV